MHCRYRFAFPACLFLVAATAIAQVPQYDHVVVLVEENKTFSELIGNGAAPYLNSVANSGALFTNSHAIEHPSQPNYLDLFSGANQGVVGDFTSPLAPFTTANLGASLLSHGLTFADYSETLPYSLPADRNTAVDPSTPGATAYGYTGDSYTEDAGLNEYERKHNPAVNWQNDTNPTANQLPSTTNQPFSAFPTDFSLLPTVSFVVPNEQDDMHDGSITQGDTWAMDNIAAYQQWALTHNSLLIITWDENDDEDLSDPNGEGTNQIVTIFSGAHIIPGQYDELITHFNVLRTLDDMYGLAPSAGDGAATAITDVFAVPEPSTTALGTVAGIFGAFWAFFRRRLPSRRRAHRKKFPLIFRFGLIAALITGIPLSKADSVIVPSELPDPNSAFGNLPATETYGDTSNLFPFFPGLNNPLRYQQVYAASQFSAFSGVIEITQIAFRVGNEAPDRLDQGAFAATIDLIQLTLSTSSASPDNLSNTFADNTGADAVTVFGTPGVGSPLLLSSTGNASGNPAPFDIVINLTTPFFYNPASGNLLLDIQNYSGAASPTGIQFDGTMVDGDSVSRGFNFGDASAAMASKSDGVTDDLDTLGLVTQFTVAVPEPAGSTLLLCAGFGFLACSSLRSFRTL